MAQSDDLARGRELMRQERLLIAKFCAYGFLKNLKFFEPFMVTVFLSWGLTLTKIGVLISVEKAAAYVLSLPAGIIADNFGRKALLCGSFLLYIASFVGFYFGQLGFPVLVGAAFLFGVGEGMRSGVHKAMVFTWLERHSIGSLKSYLNGRTRSYSLLGSAVAALGGIVLSLHFMRGGAKSNIFLCSVVPYVLDFLVVASYPSYLNGAGAATPLAAGKKAGPTERTALVDGDTHRPSACDCCRIVWKDIRALLSMLSASGAKRRALLSSVTLGSSHRLIKDYVQPVVLLFAPAIIVQLHIGALLPRLGDSSSSGSSGGVSASENKARAVIVLQGLVYFLFYICSVPASRNAFRLTSCCCCRSGNGIARKQKMAMDILMDVYAACLLASGAVLYAGYAAPVLFLYVAIYCVYNFFKPTAAATIANIAGKKSKATVLSADALLQTLVVFVLAPLVGQLADRVGIWLVFVAIGGWILLANRGLLATHSVAVQLCAATAESSSSPSSQLGGSQEEEGGEASRRRGGGTRQHRVDAPFTDRHVFSRVRPQPSPDQLLRHQNVPVEVDF